MSAEIGTLKLAAFASPAFAVAALGLPVVAILPPLYAELGLGLTAVGAIFITHMHADHFLDLVGVRYLFPWAGGASRLPVHLPPGGGSRLDYLASAISERPGFFDAAYAIDEFDPDAALTVGPLTVRFAPSRP